jgi:hypothetical protein
VAQRARWAKVKRGRKRPEGDQGVRFSEQANHRRSGTVLSLKQLDDVSVPLKVDESGPNAVILAANLKISTAAVINPNSTTIETPTAALLA